MIFFNLSVIYCVRWATFNTVRKENMSVLNLVLVATTISYLIQINREIIGYRMKILKISNGIEKCTVITSDSIYTFPFPLDFEQIFRRVVLILLAKHEYTMTHRLQHMKGKFDC